MENEEIYSYLRKFSKIHLTIVSIFWVYILMQLFSGESLYFDSKGLIVVSALALLDFLVETLKLWEKRYAWQLIRSIELVISALFLVISGSGYSLIFWGIYLIVLIFELIYRYDLTDAYNRITVISVCTIAVLGVTVLELFFKHGYQEDVFGMLCTFGIIVFFVYQIAALIAEQILFLHNKLFEQRRISAANKEAIEELRIQQEEVKRANEQLGIQKLELEAANMKINNANTEMMLQNIIMKYISTSLEINTVMKQITESVLESSELNVCAIVLKPNVVGNETTLFEIRTRISKEANKLLEKYIARNCLNDYIDAKEVFIDNRVGVKQYPFFMSHDVGSMMILPLVKEGEAIGAILCGNHGFDYFGDNLNFYETIVAQFLIALQNANLYTKMQQMAFRDSLTGIYNRGQLNKMVDEYAKEAVEDNRFLSIALFDIDKFKLINDNYGHLFGDEIIKEIAKEADEVAKKYEGIAARYGGEEFVMAFIGKNVTACISIVDELRERIGEREFYVKEACIKAYVSVGIASYPETCERVNELLNRADEAMYQSKENGRNRITVDAKGN